MCLVQGNFYAYLYYPNNGVEVTPEKKNSLVVASKLKKNNTVVTVTSHSSLENIFYMALSFLQFVIYLLLFDAFIDLGCGLLMGPK